MYVLMYVIIMFLTKYVSYVGILIRISVSRLFTNKNKAIKYLNIKSKVAIRTHCIIKTSRYFSLAKPDVFCTKIFSHNPPWQIKNVIFQKKFRNI